MATVTTTSVTDPLIYPANTLLDYTTYDGYQYAMVRASTANTFEVWRTNTGVSWSLYASLVRANVAEIGSIFISPMGYLSWVYRTNESSEDRVYYRRLSLSAATWSSEVLITSLSPNGGVAGSVWGGMDVVTVDYGPSKAYSAGVVVIAQTSNGGCWLNGISTAPGASPVLNNNALAGNRQFLPNTTTTGHHVPSIDVEHSGNTKTAGSPNLWFCYGRNQVMFNRLAWNGSGWIIPAGKFTMTAVVPAMDHMTGRWDGSRFLISRANFATVEVYERNKANTSSIGRVTPSHPASTVRQATLSYNSTNGNIRVFAVGTSNNDLYWVEYDRAGGTWNSWATVTATDITGANVNNFSVRRGTYSRTKFDVLTAHTGVDIVHTALAIPFTPLTPTWEFTNVPYTAGSAADVNASLLLDWKFNDPDPDDTQGSYAVRRQIGAGAFAYWRASDSTWQVAEVQNTSATTSLTLASGWGADGDANHNYAVKTWDAGGLASGYSTTLTLIPSAKVNPTITSPAASSTWSTDTLTVTWTVAEQTAFRAQITFLGEILEDTGKRIASDTSWTFSLDLLDTWNYTVRLYTWNNEGLQSSLAENPFSVRFVAPRTPTIVCSPNPAGGYIGVTVTNPPAATFVGAGAGAQGNNVTLNPALHANTAANDLVLVMSAIENSGTGTPNLPTPSYTSLATFGNIGLFGKIAGAGEGAPSVSFAGGVAGTATSAQTVTFREAALAALGLPFTQLNGSAQNISYLGGTPPAKNCIMILIVWKQDGAATVTTTPAGFTKIGDIFNANGQSTSWYYQIQTTATAVSSGTVTVTSGVSAISRSLLVPVSGVPLVLYNDIWRIRSDSFGDQIRVIQNVNVNGSGQDWRAISKQSYHYQAIAIGENGTSAAGLFTP